MNIFVTDRVSLPKVGTCASRQTHRQDAPRDLPDALAIVASDKWGHGYGTLPKADGQLPMLPRRVPFAIIPAPTGRNETVDKCPYWLLSVGICTVCQEYAAGYDKTALLASRNTSRCRLKFSPKRDLTKLTHPFVMAMPDEYKFDTSISIFHAYKMYIASKPWVMR
jgi:hypothetical protein